MVIEDNNEMIGAALLCETDKTHEINLISFYLLPEKIGLGIGHTFYNAMETELLNRGFQNCVIDVLENNTRAIRFYKDHGFSETCTENDAVLGDKDYKCKVFEKRISCNDE
jgi:ribosomal protein S18 acetylase RimI-like enzyme